MTRAFQHHQPPAVLIARFPRAWVRAEALVIVALSFLSLAGPLLVCEIPPLTDYPNHLARYWLIAGGVRDPALAHFYQVDWANAVTNVGVDRVIAWLSPWVSGMALGHASLVLATVLPPLGALALGLAVWRRLTPWQALLPLAAWSTTLLMGFINFEIGIGLALLFAAIDPLVQPRLGRRMAWIRAPLGLVLAVDHLFALILYAILLAGLAVGPGALRLATPAGRAEAGRRLAGAALAAAWCLIPLALVGNHPGALPGAQPPTQQIASPIQYNVMPGKLATLVSALASYNILQELVVALALIALFTWLGRRRALTAHTGLMVAFAGLLVLALVSPSRAAGASWVDKRFPTMALLCALAGLQLRAELSDRFERAVGAVTLALTCLQSTWVAWNWQSTLDEGQAVRQALAGVPAGAAVLPVQHDPTLLQKWRAPAGRYMFGVGDATYRHIDALAVPLRHAFVPNLFAARGLQPLRVLGGWDRLVEHNGADLASVSALTRPPRPGEPSYIPGWRQRFDYVLVLNADMPDQSGPFRPPAELKLVVDEGFAQLWRVVRPAGP